MEKRQLVDEVYDFFKKKLIHQFRTPKWEKIIEEDLTNIVDDSVDRICKKHFDRGFIDGQNTGVIRTRKQFENYIQKPSDNFKTRINFLFTGKL